MKTTTPETVGFSSARLARIAPVMQAYVDEGKLAGLTTLVARRGQVVHFAKYGRMDIEANEPMQADTIFRIYSMTKPITSVAVMMLYEEGLFQLNDPVSRFIPAFKDLRVLELGDGGQHKLVELEREMTIHDLLTHTSGLTYPFLGDSPVDAMYAEAEKAGLFGGDNTLSANVAELAKMPLVHQPGTVWRYSVSTDVLGHLVELIANTPFDHFLKQRLFDPLQMPDTGFYVPQAKLARLAALYGPAEDGTLKLLDPPATGEYATPPAAPSGGGGLVSTMADYLRFAQMMLNGGELDGVRLLGRKSVALMTINHLAAPLLPFGFPDGMMGGMGFGLGVGVVMDVAQTQVQGSVGNYGWGGAASTNFWIDPQEDLIGLLMTQFMPARHYPLNSQFASLTYQALVD